MRELNSIDIDIVAGGAKFCTEEGGCKGLSDATEHPYILAAVSLAAALALAYYL